jgi:oligopeptide transport system substrate-binding protein
VAHLGWPRPTLTRVTVSMATIPEADLAAYRNGTREWTLVPDAEVNAVLNDPALSAQSRQYTELTTFWVQVNNARTPLNNVLVRRALARAVDRVALVRDLATGLSQPTTSIIPPGMPGFQDGLGHELAFDAAGARALLTQAGFGDGQSFPKLTFSFPDTPEDLTRARYLQSQWQHNLGISVDLNPIDSAGYPGAIGAGDYDLALGGWSADYPDPQDWFTLQFGCTGNYNKFNYCDATVDQLAARADLSPGIADRLQLYAQAQTLLMQDLPVVPLFVRGRLVLVKPWVQSSDGGPLPLSPIDDYPGSLFLDKVHILPHQ